MKAIRVASYVLCVCLLAPAVFAEPQQRLIIQFDKALSPAQQQALMQQLQFIMPSGFSVLPHSTDQRWIILISPPVDKPDLQKTHTDISTLEHVQYVEPERVMHRLPGDD